MEASRSRTESGLGPAKVRLKVASNWDIKPAYNVIARIPGSTHPDEWVIRGNHHDAWVNGADDPVAGVSRLLEEARAFGELLKQGWKPKRTIIYCAWDAEEQGLLGSTEWGEAHADGFEKKTVAYINTDSNGRGFLSMGGSHTLEKFINDVARDIIDPGNQIDGVEDGANCSHRALGRAGAAGSPAASGFADRSSRLRVRLHRFHRPFGNSGAESRLWRGRRWRYLSFHL